MANEKLKKVLQVLKSDITDAEVDSAEASLKKEYLPEWGVPKATFNEKGEAEKLLKKQLEDSQKLLKEATAKAENSDELKKKIEELETSSSKQLKNLKLDYAIKDALKEAKAHNVDKIAAFLNREKLIIGDDGSVSGLKDQIEDLKKSDAYLFAKDETKEETPSTTKPYFGGASQKAPNNASSNTLEQKINAAFGIN